MFDHMTKTQAKLYNWNKMFFKMFDDWNQMFYDITKTQAKLYNWNQMFYNWNQMFDDITKTQAKPYQHLELMIIKLTFLNLNPHERLWEKKWRTTVNQSSMGGP